MINSRGKDKTIEWLKNFVNLKVITRDRASSYGNAISEYNKTIIQIADAFHLDENITEKGKVFIRNTIPNKIIIDENNIIKIKRIENLMYKKDEKEWSTNEQKALKKYSDVKIFIMQIYKFKHIFKCQDVRGFIRLLNKWSNSTISILRMMASSFKTDLEAIINGVKSKLTNGLAEGTVNKIKTIKRICYGRAKGDLLRCRVFLFDEIHH